MGSATVHCESFMARGHHRCSWSMHCKDMKSLPLGHKYSNGFSHETDFVKRTMLLHEAIFKNQVSELHRLYRIQINLMDEIRQKDLSGNCNQSEWNVQAFNNVSSVMIDLQRPAEEYIDRVEIGGTSSRSSWDPHRSNCSSSRSGLKPLFVQEGLLVLGRDCDLNRFYQGPYEANHSHFGNGRKGSVPDGSLTGPVSLQEPKRHDGFSLGLPWLKPRQQSYRSEVTNDCLDLNASVDQHTDETDLSPPCSNNADFHCRRSLVFEKGSVVKECDSLTSPSICIGQLKEEDKFVKRDLDMNLPCDAVFVATEESVYTFRHGIDLNSCASEDEDSYMPCSLQLETKGNLWIDLEAPAPFDGDEETDQSLEKMTEATWGSEKGKDGNFMDELIKEAAEAIVSISVSDRHCCPDEDSSSSRGPLFWFADTITSCGDDWDEEKAGISKSRHCRELDYFETMTLNLEERKEEDYMPEPLVPEDLKLDEMVSARRGQARRGRPKREFQRDILPGLASLSRHEVTEDLQALDIGIARRNTDRDGSNCGGGGRRRRRRRVVTTNIDAAQPTDDGPQVVAMEHRSLTSWARATRRPRRQRCAAGNLPTVVLT